MKDGKKANIYKRKICKLLIKSLEEVEKAIYPVVTDIYSFPHKLISKSNKSRRFVGK